MGPLRELSVSVRSSSIVTRTRTVEGYEADLSVGLFNALTSQRRTSSISEGVWKELETNSSDFGSS
jgi:hypothetical protein